VNEALAHDLIMDPHYQLECLPEPAPFQPPTPADYDPRFVTAAAQQATSSPAPSSSSSSPSRGLGMAEVQARVAATMQKLFWARLVSSLSPTAQATAADFRVGSAVQARYGGPAGAFYQAQVTAVHTSSSALEPSFDIKYAQDGVVELKCPLSQFRLASEPVDARPLMTLVTEVRVRLEKATPRRADLKAHYREVLDSEWLTQMLRKGVLDSEATLKLARFLLDCVSNLEAPARASRTAQYKDALTAYVTASSSSKQTKEEGSGGGGVAAAAATSAEKSGDEEPSTLPLSRFVRALPSLFTFLHGALDQLSRDTVNFSVAMLAPQFSGEQGVLYERRRFSDKLANGLTTLQKTDLWLGASVQSFCEDAPPPPPPGTAAGATSREGSAPSGFVARKAALSSSTAKGNTACVRALVGHALVELVAKPLRWDSLEAASVIPETLVMDATSLASVRDALDRAVLVSTLVTLLRQVLAQRRRLSPPPQKIAQLQATLDDLLKQLDTRVPALQAAILAAAKAACLGNSSESGGSPALSGSAPLSAEDGDYLTGLVATATDPNNAIFALFTKRALGLAKRMTLLPLIEVAVGSGSGSGRPSAALTGLSVAMAGGGGGAGSTDQRGASGNGEAERLGMRSVLQATLDEALPATGLAPHFRESLLNAGTTLNRIAHHNASVFAPHYSAIAQAHASALPPPPAAPMA